MRDPHSISYDGALGQQIIEMHVWAVREGLRGAAAAELFDGFCQRLVTARVPLWRGFAGMRTLHPQWAGYTYTWRRALNAIQPVQFERSDEYEQEVLNSPFTYLSRQAKISTAEGDPWLHLRRRLAGPEAALDFPLLEGASRRRCHGLFRRDRPLRRGWGPLTRNRGRLFLRDRSARRLPRR